MKPQAVKIVGLASLLIAVPGVVIPFLITFFEPIEKYLTAALHLESLAEDGFVSFDLLVYPLFFMPTNILALILGISAKCSKLGKAGCIVSGIGICMPIGAGLAVGMLYIGFTIWPPVFIFK